MTSLTDAAPRSLVDRRFAVCLLILVAVTVVRLIGLAYSNVDLFFDESQYWAWSRELAFGYFSKPPLLAWVIAGAEAVCGSGEACIRAPAPILYLGTCLVSYAIARTMYDETTAFWAAILLGLSGSVAFSSRIISTDVPLLFFWAVALLSYVKLLQGGDWRWGLLLGVSFGLGMLAKYAMIYFVLGVIGAALIDRDARALLRSPLLWLAAAIGVAFILPNVIWNAQNGFVTLTHTGHNIGGGGVRFNPLLGLEFLASQFAVFGPVTFAVFLIVLVRMAKPEVGRADRLMLCFAIPTLVLVTATAFVTRANANWAAPAFISANVLVAAVLVRHAAWRWIALSIVIGIIAQVALLAGDANARRLSVSWLAKPDVYARTMGWRSLGEEVGKVAHQTGARTIVGEQRDTVASLIYYQRDSGRTVLSWPSSTIPNHHFDLTRRMTGTAPEPVLFVSYGGTTERLARYYRNVEPLGQVVARVGPTTSRSYFVFKLSGAASEIGLLSGC
ncbi:MAG: phospholipid carrier-dependent glycosyltransferase [Rhizobiales bacterium]|nr:phospholipid carrier-dependent glycosyltransferase [Hyphomicrobiales bacterium]